MTDNQSFAGEPPPALLNAWKQTLLAALRGREAEDTVHVLIEIERHIRDGFEAAGSPPELASRAASRVFYDTYRELGRIWKKFERYGRPR